MPLQAIEPRRLYRQIADQLQALIAAGEWALGSRLPAERELAARLGVSRPSVREALIALEVRGLVEVRMGSGIYVVAREPAKAAAAALAEPAHGPFEIIRARQLIEGELAAQAAQQMDAAALAGLDEALALMATEIAGGKPPVRGDRLFHLRIAEAADNGPLLRTVGELYDARHEPLYQQLGRHYESLPGWQAALDEHRAVLQAIRAGHPAAARQRMQQHLQCSHDRLAGLAGLTAPAGPAATAPTGPATTAPAGPASPAPAPQPTATRG